MAQLLGIDTGGTYTDAVLVNDQLEVIKKAKSLTTKDNLIEGISKAADQVLDQADQPISMVSLSTTLATNAIVEGQGNPVCLLIIDTSDDALQRSGLKEALGGDPAVVIKGGHRTSGEPVTGLDIEAAREAILKYKDRVSAFAVAGSFAVRNPAHENQVKELIRELSGLPVSCGHELSSALDAPRRALTAVLNARLISLLQQLIESVQSLLNQRSIEAPIMIVKGDGSLMRAEEAVHSPVETILSGPAASVIGARHLAKQPDMVVSDMGGTTTDIAVLKDGRPLLNREGASVGGWRTMVEAVQVHTFGLGGDSQLHLEDPEYKAGLHLGPRRAKPLSLLGQEHPEIIEVLKEQLEEFPIHPNAGEFVTKLRTLKPGQRLSPKQQALYDKLNDGPLAFRSAADVSSEIAIRQLCDRGIVIMSTFTPSDAAHVLGRQQSWCSDTANLAAQVWLKRSLKKLKVDWQDSRDFARAVLAQTALQTAEYLVSTSLSEKSGDVGRQMSSREKALFLQAVTPAEDDLLRIRMTLEQPLVAIGAPAACHYPAVAELLDAELEVPEHADISNALGAVTAMVVEKIHLLITPLGNDSFRVHMPEGIETFEGLEPAKEFAQQEAVRLAIAQAKRNGAVEVDVRDELHENIYRDDMGLEMFIEAEMVATAFGYPERLAV